MARFGDDLVKVSGFFFGFCFLFWSNIKWTQHDAFIFLYDIYM